ncbi:hypothetical protein HanPSC8_Chr11g0454301 [Helianthus annuus]|nr:hypothetical protein HanHA89_Chr11g0409351 [Helianthus annuus]KAJ0873598.1 hypothetical protein HanPSC8_Chr11g0454301 [Helianthus annuus]
MDIFDIHNVKVEKANAMLQYRRFRKIAKLFRLVELFFAVILFSWTSIRLPFVIGILSDYFRQLFSIIVSPIFIFLIGNVIIVFLVVKSGQITENSSELDDSGSDLYEKIANNVQEDDVHVHDVQPVIEPEQIVYQDKRVVSEVNNKPINDNKIKVRQATNKNLKPKPVSNSDLEYVKVYRRSQSENLTKNECFPVPEKLKRSETEIGRRTVETPVTENVANDDVVEELSNEEFQKRIERFIARQIKFHQKEKLAIVAHKS